MAFAAASHFHSRTQQSPPPLTTPATPGLLQSALTHRPSCALGTEAASSHVLTFQTWSAPDCSGQMKTSAARQRRKCCPSLSIVSDDCLMRARSAACLQADADEAVAEVGDGIHK